MSREDIIRKLTSRKFWLAVAAFVTDLIVAFKGDAELAETLSGMIMAGATVIAYIVGEGLIDAGNTESECTGEVQSNARQGTSHASRAS